MTGETQQAVIVKAFDAENWQNNISLEQVRVPEPSGSQALVKIVLRPVNPSDLLAVQGVYAGFQPDKLPATPGMEALGKIVKSAGKFKEGQRVVGAPWPASKGYGTFQEYYVVEEDVLHAVPDGISDEAAASFWINPLKTINLVRRSEQKQELLDIGADVVIGTDETPEFVEEVKRITEGEGAWGGIDPIAGEMTSKMLSAIRSKGKILVYGVLSGLKLEAYVPDLLFLQKQIFGFWLVPWFDQLPKEDQTDVIKEVFRLLKAKVIKEFKSETFDLKDVVKALEETTKTGNAGKGYLQ